MRQTSYLDALDYLNQALHMTNNDYSYLNSLHLKAKTLFKLDKKTEASHCVHLGIKLAKLVTNQRFMYKFNILVHQIKGTTDQREFVTKLENEMLAYFEQNERKGDYYQCLELLADIFYRRKHYKKSSDYYKTLYHLSKLAS
ncbi:hypothetical protein [Aquibacillus sediminis]|uniref:hypothetical protein n=1 Tax=Aquibacillus sediminis TaxID=2574734 RepID=UPI001108B2F1|nr:hypothetical protein [Aquibacillus sediminis]